MIGRLDEWSRQDEDEDSRDREGTKTSYGSGGVTGCASDKGTSDWVTHTFREHKEADIWAGKGTRACRRMGGHDRIAWQEVLGICGFWDGRFDKRQMREWHCPHGLLGPARMVLLLQQVRSCTRE